MEDRSIDLILTDIPYGEVNRKTNGLRNMDKGIADSFNMELKSLCNEMCRITNGSIYIFCGTEQVSEIRKVLVENEMSTRLLIWEKPNPSPMNGEYIWLNNIECCVYGKYKGATFNEFCKGTILRFKSGSSKWHPTEKPLDMFQYLIKTSTKLGDLVYDPFLGSGTTAVACKSLGRNYVGSEISKKYCKIAEERLKQEYLF
jgi:site-specific DNA-methyltransferase (adenine-specific)